MEAPHGDYVVLESLKVGTRDYQPGDRFERARHLSRKELDERTLEVLEKQNRFAPLTRASYGRAIVHRPGDIEPRIGRGWTLPELEAKGIIDPGQKPAAPPAAAKPPAERTALDPIPYKGFVIQPQKVGRFTLFAVQTADGELVRAQAFKRLDRAQVYVDGLRPADQAIPAEVEALPTDGKTWTDDEFKVFADWFESLPEGPTPVYVIHNPAVAEAFRLLRDGSTDSAASATPGAEEATDGGDVQSEPEHRDLEGSPAPG